MTARRTREDIVEAAGRLFAERGFHGTSMRDLGGELGILGSSLYSHIGGKSELLVEVIGRGGEMFQTLADEVTASDDPPPEQLRLLVAGHVRIIVDHLDEARTFLNEARFLPDSERAVVIAKRDRYQSAYRSVLAAGRRQEDFRADLDPHLGAIFVLSLLNALDRWYRPEGEQGPDEIAAHMYEFIRRGIT